MGHVFMMVGVPCSGKSTWVRDVIEGGDYVASTDDYIEREAGRRGLTYSEVFGDVIGDATRAMYGGVGLAIQDGRTVFWDQTNLTRSGRAKKLSMFPEGWVKCGVIFETPSEGVLRSRLAARSGKVIPWEVVEGMIAGYDPVESGEFDRVVHWSVDYGRGCLNAG